MLELILKHKIDASRLCNMDETGVNTSKKRSPKILSTTGKKQMGIIARAKRAQYNGNLLPHCSWFVHPTISHICTKTYAGTPS
jgi:hypothetical protein